VLWLVSCVPRQLNEDLGHALAHDVGQHNPTACTGVNKITITTHVGPFSRKPASLEK
jgi:hypothetical protein